LVTLVIYFTTGQEGDVRIFDNDRTLYTFIIGQAKLPDSPFEVSDHSLKEAAFALFSNTTGRGQHS
jgi:hypothetical protein